MKTLLLGNEELKKWERKLSQTFLAFCLQIIAPGMVYAFHINTSWL